MHTSIRPICDARFARHVQSPRNRSNFMQTAKASNEKPDGVIMSIKFEEFLLRRLCDAA